MILHIENREPDLAHSHIGLLGIRYFVLLDWMGSRFIIGPITGLWIKPFFFFIEFFRQYKAQSHRDENKTQGNHLPRFVNFSGDKVG